MRWSIVIYILFISSCGQLSEIEKLHQNLSGDWIIVYPDHQLKNDMQELIYGRIQDSIVSLTGLKLIRLSHNGVFQQMDSVHKKGKWGITADNIVFVEGGGMGFENFSSRFTRYKDGLLELTEIVDAAGEKIELRWNLKKINGGSGANLFEDNNNAWRKRPAQPESEKQVRQRLSDMLRYYSGYFKLVNKEASFFVTSRILLPFKFYQHAMGLSPFDENSFFVQLFFNKEQAEQAWLHLKRTLNRLKNDFPRTKNYVEEYAEFMEKMSEEIVKD